MEGQKKCSHKKHSEINAISYCQECNLYLCNKCTNIHLEYLDTHHNYNIDKNNQDDIFTGICNEPNHTNKLEFYCKSHNKLCCVACLCKFKEKGNGQHSDCNVCSIENIMEEKKSKLAENIKKLEEFSEKIKESIKKLKEIFEKINEDKEKIKMNISKIFTKIREALNEREDKLLIDLDNVYEKTFFKEDLLKKGEKMPNQIIKNLEVGKKLNQEWDGDNNKMIKNICGCINIENNIQNVIEINESIEQSNKKEINIQFFPGEEQISKFIENIKTFGEITDEYNFIFKQGNNYTVTKNGLIATKDSDNRWDCVIIGDKEIPKNKISKWKIKINKGKSNIFNTDIVIGIGPDPKKFKNNPYLECWSIASCGNMVKLYIKSKNINYNDHKENIKAGDIIEVIIDRKLGNLSFALNDVNYGIACSEIPKDEELFPTVVLFEKGLEVELV